MFSYVLKAMKTKTEITCDYCGTVATLAEQGYTGSNPLRGWMTIHDNDVENTFCSAKCKNRFCHPEQHHVFGVRRFIISRIYDWPITPRS